MVIYREPQWHPMMAFWASPWVRWKRLGPLYGHNFSGSAGTKSSPGSIARCEPHGAGISTFNGLTKKLKIFTGNHLFSHERCDFPVTYPLNQ